MTNKPKVLIYDIETSLLLVEAFRMGEQRVNHGQLLGGYFSRSHIFCISYSWDFGKTQHALDWGNTEEDEKDMIIAFDELIKEADIVIGKNSDRFDNKHINTHRLWNGLPGMPYWTKSTDDLEKQLRKHFDVPSQSLDYWSSQFGLGGKDKMSFEDWKHIGRLRALQLMNLPKGPEESFCQVMYSTDAAKVHKEGVKALNKMKKYNKKDVKDTGMLWKICEKHFIPKNKANKIMRVEGDGCEHCASKNLRSKGNKISGATYYKYLLCLDCKGTSRVVHKPEKK